MDASHCSSIPPTSNSTELSQLNELILRDGKYEGELKDNLRHGLGIFIWDNGDAYFGSWVDDRMHGKGIFCYNTGHYVEGTFAYDFLEGPACITYPDKSFTKGIFKRGELNGRVLSYKKENHSWALQEYERGTLKGMCYEGKGMPLTYDFSLNTYGQDFGGFEKKNDNTDINYAIKSIKRDKAAAYSVGCFELEYGMKHYGIIKNNRMEGLGIRFIIKGIEIGKYREDRLDGAARKLEFGRELYEGEFLQGRYYGHGKLWEWKKRDNLMVITTGILTSGIIMQKIKEERASLDILNETLRYDANDAKVVKMSIRDYRDTFAKDYAEIDPRNDDSKTIETTIKEIAYAKILSRETVIECQEVQKSSIPEPLTPESIQNSPSRRALMETSSHLAKMVNALNNDPYDVTTTLQATQGYIDRLKKRLDDQERSRSVQNKPPKRSQSSERERDMEPSFSQVFTIGIDDKPSTVRTHRSVSRDTARYGHVTINYPFNQVIVQNQIQENDSSRNPRNVGLENKSKPMTANIDAKYNFGSESVRSTARHHTETEPRTAYTIQDSDPKLTKMQKNSRSSTNLHAKTVETNHEESSERVVKTLAFSGVREPSPVRKAPLVISTKRLSSESSTFSQKTAASASKLSGDKAPVKFGSSRNLNTESTPKKGHIMQTSMNRANSSSNLSSKKASTSTVTKGKTPLPKNPTTKDKYGIAGSALKSLPNESSFLGNSPSIKKAIPASAVLPKSRDSSRINKQSNNDSHNKSYLNQDTRRCHTTVETYDISARKSARPTARGTSPAQVIELDLQCYSTAAKTGNDRKDTRCDTSEKSVASTNIWSAQKASYLKEEPSYTAPDDIAYQGSVQRTMPTERNSTNKQSARSKSPLLSNIVSIDISMFKAGEGDGQKQASPERLQTIQDNSPIYMDTKSSFISNGFEQYINHIVDGPRSGENTAFTFMPAKDILGTFAKKREEKAFGKAGVYGIEDDGQIESKREIGVKNNLAPLVHYDLQSNNVGHSFERKDNAMINGDKESKQNQDGEEINKSKATPGHNVNTPSFSQKNFKFTITDNIKLNYDTPKKGGRYEALDLKSQQNIIETLNSPPYKSSAQKQLDFVVKSSGKGKISAPESPVKNKITENDSVDSFSGYYPIKKTCGLQSDSYHSESLGSARGSPQKSTSQKGSPTKQIRPVFTNQSDIISPKTSQCQVMMTESNNDNIKIIGEDANQYPETLSIGFSSNRGDTPSRLVKGLKEESECKLDLQALPTLSSKYENLKESERIPLTGSSSGKPADISPERKDKSQSSQASSKATSTAYFGLRSGPATPQIDFDISSNYPIVKQHPVEEAVHNNDQADYFSLRPTQQDNFSNKLGVKRPKLVVEPKGAMNNGAYSISTSDYRSKIGEVEHYMSESPYKREASNRVTEQDKSMVSAISSIQEEWGTTKDVNNLSNFHFGAEDYNTKISKFTMAPQGQLSQIYNRLEETRTTLSYKAQPNVRVFQSKNDGRGHEQVFGNAIAMNGLYNPGSDLRPPMSGNRYKSANKSYRNGDVSRGGDNDLSVSFVEEEARSRRVNQSSGNKIVYDRYRIADEDDISEEKNENLRHDLMSRRKMETKRASAENDFSGTSAKRMK